MHAIVIGAGVTGLATAALLLREGYAVTVVEKNSTYGGRAGSVRAGGFRWDAGPSWYLMPEAYDHFFELCGTSTAAELDLVDLTPAYRVFNDTGQRFDVETGRAPELFEAIEPGAGARLEQYLAEATEAYELSLRRFLYTTFANPLASLRGDVLRRAGQFLRLLGSSLQSRVNARFTHPVLRQILSYPAVFLSTQPSSAPALYALMSHTDLVDGVRYPQGGFQACVDACYRQAAGAKFLFDTPVTEIVVRNGAAVGVTTPAGFLAADVVVSCADLHHTETELVPAGVRSYPEKYWARRDPGLGATLLYLGVRGELPELDHHNLLLSTNWEQDFAAVYGDNPGASRCLYISKPSATDATVAPAGHENLFVLVPCSVDAQADAASVIAQISTWCDIPDLAERVVECHAVHPQDFAANYNAWRGGALGPAHTLRQSAFLRGRNASAKVAGLYYAGATTVPGVGVPMCLISAENVIKRLRGDRGTAPLTT